ncbi:MAG: hypothetical protein KatS3mg111_2139 [Pirellulaceae bacterium]|nr:MAG: hypothetical protein KatS3mg111_2139 [Pirellulaceae bacterium]
MRLGQEAAFPYRSDRQRLPYAATTCLPLRTYHARQEDAQSAN